MPIHRVIFKSRHTISTDLWYGEVNESNGLYRHIHQSRTRPETAWVDIQSFQFRNDHPEFSQALLSCARGESSRLQDHWGFIAYFVEEVKPKKSGLSRFLEEKCNA